MYESLVAREKFGLSVPGVAASDALEALNRAIGQPLALTCNLELGDGVAVTTQPVQSGQTTCYDTGGNYIDRAGSGQDGEFQAGLRTVCNHIVRRVTVFGRMDSPVPA